METISLANRSGDAKGAELRRHRNVHAANCRSHFVTRVNFYVMLAILRNVSVQAPSSVFGHQSFINAVVSKQVNQPSPASDQYGQSKWH
jgi:hypothetical protein